MGGSWRKDSRLRSGCLQGADGFRPSYSFSFDIRFCIGISIALNLCLLLWCGSTLRLRFN